MDTFTTITAATMFLLIYMGERFKAGVYLLLATIFAILLAWRMGEVVYYIGSGVLITVLIHRAFFPTEDIRDDSEMDGDN